MEKLVETTLDASGVRTLQNPPGKSRVMTPKHVVAVAIALGALVMIVGMQIESVIIRMIGATGHQLEWISDVIASVMVTTVTYLWLHLRITRAELLDAVRTRAIHDEQFRLAAGIQRNLLPEIPPATPGYLWAARMEAAHQIGGDFYDFVTTDEGAVLLILGDVSGKGMPAALMQSSLMTLFRVHASMATDPDTIASRMSESLLSHTGGQPYATAILARLDRFPRRITYVNAGHPPGLILREAGTLTLDAGGPPLGLLPKAKYARVSFDLAPGDLGVLVTDGVTEALEGIPLPLGQALGNGHLPQSSTLQEDCDHLLRIAASAPGPPGAGAWSDDRTVLAFRVLDDRPL
jgi:serine phosphatase RsbU (regulator of sigma subunit)